MDAAFVTTWKVHEAASGDRADPGRVAFYAGRRAALRAKLAMWHLRDDHVRANADWRAVASSYLRLASAHAGRLPSRRSRSAGT